MIKRKHKTLSIKEKNEIIERLRRGETQNKLAAEYGIGRATIHNIYTNRKNIYKQATFSNYAISHGKRQTLKKPKYPEVEQALYSWFSLERRQGNRIFGPMILCKANYFYKQITKKCDFVPSTGWLERFKKRHGIRLKNKTDQEPINESPSLKDNIETIQLPNSEIKIEIIESSEDAINVTSNLETVANKYSQEWYDAKKEYNTAYPHLDEETTKQTCSPYVENDVTQEETKASSNEAVSSFDVCLKWAEENDYTCCEILLLRKMRDKALSGASITPQQTKNRRPCCGLP